MNAARAALAFALVTIGSAARPAFATFEYSLGDGFWTQEITGDGVHSSMHGVAGTTSAWTTGFLNASTTHDPDGRGASQAVTTSFTATSNGEWSFTANGGGLLEVYEYGGHASTSWNSTVEVLENGVTLYSIPGAGSLNNPGMDYQGFNVPLQGEMIEGNTYTFLLTMSAGASCMGGYASFTGGNNTELEIRPAVGMQSAAVYMVPEPAGVTLASLGIATALCARRRRAPDRLA